MSELWEPNEVIDEEDELVVTDHRDGGLGPGYPEDDSSVETTVTDGSQVLEEFGEDVASSPAQRGADQGDADY